MSFFVIRTAETWTFGNVVGALLLLAGLLAVGAAIFSVTRDR
ncbi:MAG: hypothetical protein RI637_06060 [Acidimicrobiia bacterium]|nr:hypothetical protein [Acidimicrobiia bacterium]